MSSGHLFCADRNGVKKLSVLAQDYPSEPANPSSLAKRDARGCANWLIYESTCEGVMYRL